MKRHVRGWKRCRLVCECIAVAAGLTVSALAGSATPSTVRIHVQPARIAKPFPAWDLAENGAPTTTRPLTSDMLVYATNGAAPSMRVGRFGEFLPSD